MATNINDGWRPGYRTPILGYRLGMLTHTSLKCHPCDQTHCEYDGIVNANGNEASALTKGLHIGRFLSALACFVQSFEVTQQLDQTIFGPPGLFNSA